MKVSLFSVSIIALLVGASGDVQACKVKGAKRVAKARSAPPTPRPVSETAEPAPTPATPAPAVEEARPAKTEPEPSKPPPEPVKPAEPAKPEPAAPAVEETDKPAPAPGKFKNEIHFTLGRDTLTPQAKKALDGVARWMAANPTARITIEGHADQRGSDDANMDLSRARADAVKAFLESKGVEGGRLETSAFGEAKPKYPGSDGRNRRAMLVPQQ